jgi:alpha/beta superfamily hydrolase
LEALVQTVPPPKQLVVIPDADHFFEGRLREMRTAVELWISEAINL